MGEWQRVTCEQSETVGGGRSTLHVSSSLTNFVGGEVLDHGLPPVTRTTWCNDDDVDVLRDELDEHGCRHWEAVDG